jgi:glutamate/tyrosine decarboxylase-like PLP-dependent enzyme
MRFDDLRRTIASIEADVADGPIVPSVKADEIRRHLARYDFTAPRDLNDVGADVERMLKSWHVQVTHPRYLGLFNPSVVPAAVVGEVLTAAYNPQLASWRTSPAANEIEQHTLRWLAAKFGFPDSTASTFTTGGAEANLSAVIVALTRAFPTYGSKGLRSLARTPAIYLSQLAHHSFNKIAHMTGLGRESLRSVQCDAALKLDIAHLKRQLDDDRRSGFEPFLVVGTAGTTAAGTIDPLQKLADFCESQRLWFHVDAAWGGAAILSPRLRPYLAGIERADSITCDAHKWFSVPMGAGMFFCRHCGVVDEAFRVETSYMPRKMAGPVRDPYTTSVQWSRRFVGLKLFLALAEKGEPGYVESIEHQTRMGDVLRGVLRATGWRIVNSTPLPLVCFTRDSLDTTSFLSALYARQIAWISDVRLDDRPPVLRACITSYRTTEADIDYIVRQMNELVEEAHEA